MSEIENRCKVTYKGSGVFRSSGCRSLARDYKRGPKYHTFPTGLRDNNNKRPRVVIWEHVKMSKYGDILSFLSSRSDISFEIVTC